MEDKNDPQFNSRGNNWGNFVVYTKRVVLSALFLVIVIFSTGVVVHAAGVQGGVDYPNFFTRIIDSTFGVIKDVFDWIQEQNNRVASILTRTSSDGFEVGQVLGESVDMTQDIIEDLPEDLIIAQSPEPEYSARYISQSSEQVFAEPGVDYELSVAYQNTGNAWENQSVSLNIVWPDSIHPLRHAGWITDRRPASSFGSIGTGETYEFSFLVSVPQDEGVYDMRVRPVAFTGAGFVWIGDEARWSIESKEQELIESIKDEELDAVIEDKEEFKEEETKDKPEDIKEEIKPRLPQTLPFPILMPDQVPPNSCVSALSATSTRSSITVEWTGQDNISATLYYDIQYQVDSGGWIEWLSETVLMSSLFAGQDEKTYAFRSRARDSLRNWEEWPEQSDAGTYFNLSAPNNPLVTSHTSGQSLSGGDDEDPQLSDVQITLSGTGDANDTLVIVLSGTSTTSTTTISSLGLWSQEFTLEEGDNSFTLQSSEADGDSSSVVNFNLTLNLTPTHDVVVNEIAWMGTRASVGDEWMELYNASSTAISLSGWTLLSKDGTPSITLGPDTCSNLTIESKSYFLLEKTNDDTIRDIVADCVYSGTQIMGNEGELLSLRNSSNILIDRVGSSTASWFAGDNSSDVNRATMERKDPTESGTDSSNWAANDTVTVNGKDANLNNLKATPRALNSANTTIPFKISDLQFQYIYTTSTSVMVYFTAPKNANLATTTQAAYDIRYSTSPITQGNWASATQAETEPAPSITQGTAQTFNASGLLASTQYFFGIKTNNGAEEGALSNIAQITTKSGNYTVLGGFPIGTLGIVASSSSPYIVTDNIVVDFGSTLVIQSGAVLKMDGNYTITVNGSMVMGDENDPVNGAVITSKDDDSYADPYSTSDHNPSAGDWGRILASALTSRLDFDNAILRYGGNINNMIEVSGSAEANIARSIIEHSNSTGIEVSSDASALTLSDSIVRDNYFGIEINSFANATITGSTITGTTPGQWRGIVIDSNADVDNILITGNNIYAHKRLIAPPAAGIYYQDTDTVLPAANITNNWWGASSGPTQDTHSVLDDIDGIIDDNNGILTNVQWPVSFAATQFEIKPSGL